MSTVESSMCSGQLQMMMLPAVTYIRLPSQTPSLCHDGDGSRNSLQRTDVLAQAAFDRFKGALATNLFVPHKFHPRNAAFEPPVEGEVIRATHVTIEMEEGLPNPAQSLEAYRLQVQRTGEISIFAASSTAVLHALSTLVQIFYFHSQNNGVYTPHAPVLISDWPRFQHRGLNLDISRSEIAPNDVIRTLDAMSLNKFNRLHLHATDSQSWPLGVPALPKLAFQGVYRIEQQWSPAELRTVQEYGATRGIDVYLEIDMPGHTSSVFHSYPNLVVAFNQPLVLYSASEPPSGQLSLNDSRVHEFVEKLLVDLLQRSSPYSSLFHLGGDEVNTKVYELDPSVNSSSKDVIRPLLQEFYNQALLHVHSFSMNPVFWEETVLEWDINLPSNAIIQVWRSPAALKAVVAKGYRALFGAASHWYLDCGFGSFLDPDPSNPQTITRSPYLDWCSPYKNWRNIYSYNPLEGISEDKSSLVIGGEVHLWSELTDSISLDGKLWPRAAAAAEILWKGPGTVNESVTFRLAEMRERLIRKGIRASVVQMEWCLMNPGQCMH
ncbi:N-acetyl-glucosamine-6-phosphate deacetylase [Thelotrema lepadinum]|nr:N-acetyl-glucosamine-6-phosphate deacetylase [Thelotrema lepadinum]